MRSVFTAVAGGFSLLILGVLYLSWNELTFGERAAWVLALLVVDAVALALLLTRTSDRPSRARPNGRL